jgi:predicted metal-binding membrane protein
MTGMAMHHHAGLAEYVGMWMLTMVPMMLPSLVPVLLRYRRSVRGAELEAYGLTGLVMAGYYTVWVVIGVAVWAAGAGIMAAEMRWGWVGEWRSVGVGVLLLVGGGVQASEWKARQLAVWHEMAVRGGSPEATALGPVRLGLHLGVRCSLGCGNLMLALFAIGMMNVVAMAVMTVVITAERLVPATVRCRSRGRSVALKYL